MTDVPHATAIAVAPSPSRWIPFVMMILGIITAVSLLVSALTAIGAWRSQVDLSINELRQRMDKAEENQRTYIPVLIGLSKDVTYLAERARREDERRDRSRGTVE